MNYFIDIKLLENKNLNLGILMSKLYSQLHIALVNTKEKSVAISFPEHTSNIGNTLRLHGSLDALQDLMSTGWTDAFKDYINCSLLKEVPKQIAGYRTVFRVTPKSPAALRRRSVKKGWLTEEEALQKIPDSKRKVLDLPFINTRSHSNGNPIKLFIKHGDIVDKPSTGDVSTYGLSKSQTIPWF
ncbi:type I-F CRISPR-associated endoribonuclease Cas6/Csy4 [Vibrio sp. D431a]|uniref:type I-F CRISPR-associated endoribonuclease Cas6/Csy4 n=1 Tax=Vibrio sp. D431a TaxID=2837388 RepID=UPI002554F96C|nr:type I-F CRISPR-associated endoribonuclease Cas6/Csy4 [Vibrio sp. D431a]MDK9790062.1 type I-F CRISPR-associated endoribonuclease Cas6/Csy4 [Vibrio sp. D431a]